MWHLFWQLSVARTAEFSRCCVCESHGDGKMFVWDLLGAERVGCCENWWECFWTIRANLNGVVQSTYYWAILALPN